MKDLEHRFKYYTQNSYVTYLKCIRKITVFYFFNDQFPWDENAENENAENVKTNRKNW